MSGVQLSLLRLLSYFQLIKNRRILIPAATLNLLRKLACIEIRLSVPLCTAVHAALIEQL